MPQSDLRFSYATDIGMKSNIHMLQIKWEHRRAISSNEQNERVFCCYVLCVISLATCAWIIPFPMRATAPNDMPQYRTNEEENLE